MTPRLARTVAWAVVLIAVGAGVASTAIALGFPNVPQEFKPPRALVFGMLTLGLAVPGALILARYPRHAIAWLLCGTAVVGAIEHVVASYAGAATANALPFAVEAAWLFSWLAVLHFVPLAALPLLFPDGCPPSPRWRPVLWSIGIGTVGFALAIALADIPIPIIGIRNPMGLAGNEAPVYVLVASVSLLTIAAMASVLSLLWRYRRSTYVARQQLKWVMYASVAGVGTVLVAIYLAVPIESLAVVTGLGLVLMPVAVAIAILRHRLYDIDVLINRTLVYGALSATLAGAYVGSVLLLQTVLRPITADNEIAVAVSTLAVVALFQPLRRRIQGAVDRRFYRSRYDAARTIDRFSARLRDQVDLDALRGELVGVVADTVQPAHASLWLRRR